MTRRRVRALSPVWAAVVAINAAGCTICPDPFDYTGPVPNGSAPQNDFRARSGGVAPLDGVPRPWPPVVKGVPRATDEPPAVLATAAKPAVDESAAEPADGPADVQPVAAEGPAENPVEDTAEESAVADDAADVDPSPIESTPAEPKPAPLPIPDEIPEDEAAGDDAGIDEADIDEILPPARPLRPVIAPPLRETPGWRPRG